MLAVWYGFVWCRGEHFWETMNRYGTCLPTQDSLWTAIRPWLLSELLIWHLETLKFHVMFYPFSMKQVRKQLTHGSVAASHSGCEKSIGL